MLRHNIAQRTDVVLTDTLNIAQRTDVVGARYQGLRSEQDAFACLSHARTTSTTDDLIVPGVVHSAEMQEVDSDIARSRLQA